MFVVTKFRVGGRRRRIYQIGSFSPTHAKERCEYEFLSLNLVEWKLEKKEQTDGQSKANIIVLVHIH
jgi:hypothetical protein